MAEVSGLAISALSRLKSGRREPTRAQAPALMRLTGLDLYDLLRIERPELLGVGDVDAVPAAPAPAPQDTWPESPAPPPRPAPAQDLSGLRPTAAQLQTALRYRLEPGPTWRAFLASPGVRLQDLDGQWLAWCEACGDAPSRAEIEVPAPLQTPEGLYAHLHPVDRGPDMRAPPAPGTGVRFVPK